ncbi:MAG: hypothetical protein AMJ84_05960 [Acidithiobacillales bacterium SM23_46]|nr:MAG: hypothetical protein AMJ84_05960 [Acidithiobacillales bacterium SM23_46]
MHGKKDGSTQSAIEKKLSKVVDPGTGLDVLRMGMIHDLNVSDGVVSLAFGPSSRHCPLAFRLGVDVYEAVRSIEGVKRVVIRVENFDRAAELEQMLREKARGPSLPMQRT